MSTVTATRWICESCGMVYDPDVGDPDGLIGPRIVDAVKAFQSAEGIAPDGYAGQKVLRALQGPILLR